MCKKLVGLVLSHSEVGGDVMEQLGKYPKHRNVVLLGAELLEKNLICGADSFPELKSLSLLTMPSLQKWEVGERALAKLNRLVIRQCSNLEMIPDGIRFLSTLGELEMYMPKQVNDKLRVVNGEEGEDYYKVEHIASVKL